MRLTIFGKDAKVEDVQRIPRIYISGRDWDKGSPVQKEKEKGEEKK